MPHDHNAIERSVEDRHPEPPMISIDTKNLVLAELTRMHGEAKANADIHAGVALYGPPPGPLSPVRLAEARLAKISQALREVEALPVRP